MKLAVVGPAPPQRGGIAQHTRAIARAFRASPEHEVAVFPFTRLYPRMLFPGKSELAPDAATEEETRTGLDPYRPLTWRRVARAVAAESPDLVLVQWWHPWFAVPTAALLGMLAGSLGRSRLALLCHNVEPHARVPLQRVLARRVIRRAGRIVVHARAEAERARVHARPGTPVDVLPMPRLIDPVGARPSRAEARRGLGLEGGCWLLFFGHVRPYKGLADLIEALARIDDADLRLAVVGEFYDPEEHYRRQVGRLGLEGRVRLVNRFLPDAEVGAWFAACDGVVLPYRDATQSSVLPLAIDHRRPFVVTDAGGLAETAPRIGVVARPGAPDDLAAAIRRMLAGPLPGDDAFDAAASAISLDAWRDRLLEVAAAAASGARAVTLAGDGAHG